MLYLLEIEQKVNDASCNMIQEFKMNDKNGRPRFHKYLPPEVFAISLNLNHTVCVCR